MTDQVTIELIKLTPTVLQLAFIAILIAIFYRPLRRELLPRISGFKAFGIEATFVREELDKAASKQAASVSDDERSQVLRRAARNATALQGAQVLWVDDNPDNNISERRILLSLGITVEQARSTAEALAKLRQKRYDAVISDMTRDGVPTAGLVLLQEMQTGHGLAHPVIFYAGGFDPSRGVPAYAFGMTNRPDQLLHYIMDAVERKRS